MATQYDVVIENHNELGITEEVKDKKSSRRRLQFRPLSLRSLISTTENLEGKRKRKYTDTHRIKIKTLV